MRFAHLAALVAAVAVASVADASQTVASDAPIADGSGAWTKQEPLIQQKYPIWFDVSKDGLYAAYWDKEYNFAVHPLTDPILTSEGRGDNYNNPLEAFTDFSSNYKFRLSSRSDGDLRDRGS